MFSVLKKLNENVRNYFLVFVGNNKSPASE